MHKLQGGPPAVAAAETAAAAASSSKRTDTMFESIGGFGSFESLYRGTFESWFVMKCY
jgi:hypothetical protein